jgi:hypothetical protein
MSQVDWIIIGVLLLLGLILPKRKNTEKKDRTTFIESNGFQYEELASLTHLKKLHLWGFKLLLKGDNEEVTKLMFKKDNNLDLFIFEYKYQGVFDGPTNNSTITYSYQKAVYFEFVRPQNVSFNLYPEGLIEKTKQYVLLNDIDFNDYTVFSKSYALYGENEEAIRKLFTKALLEFLEQNKGFSVEYRKGGMLIHKKGNTPYSKIELLLNDARFIKDQLCLK